MIPADVLKAVDRAVEGGRDALIVTRTHAGSSQIHLRHTGSGWGIHTASCGAFAAGPCGHHVDARVRPDPVTDQTAIRIRVYDLAGCKGAARDRAWVDIDPDTVLSAEVLRC